MNIAHELQLEIVLREVTSHDHRALPVTSHDHRALPAIHNCCHLDRIAEKWHLATEMALSIQPTPSYNMKEHFSN
jgi:hypothetical protein